MIGITNEINVINPETGAESDSSEDDDSVSRDNVIAVSFVAEASAYEALARLKELDAQGDIDLRAGAVVAREDDGSIAVRDQYAEDSMTGTASGGLIGLLVGIFGGPLGVLVGGATGVLVGSLLRRRRR